MPRPSKLSPEQWRVIAERAAAGEHIRALAREFGISEGAIRQRVSTQTTQIRSAAQKLAEGRIAVAALPIPQQYVAVNLADKMVSTSRSLASAAELGAATSHRLSALANSEAARIDDANVLSTESMDALRGVAALTKVANDASHIGVNLLSAKIKSLPTGADEDDPSAEVRKSLHDLRAKGGKTALLPGAAVDLDDD